MHDSWYPPGPAMLFCPADRPDRFTKAAERADVVILDLEDAVPPESRAAARDALVSNPLDPERTVVRINAAGTEDHLLDLEVVNRAGYRVIMLAKAEDSETVARCHLPTIALVETALGAVRAQEIAATGNCVGLMWGAEDLAADLGGNSSRFGPDEPGAGRYRDVPRHVRASVRLAAGAFGRFAVDSVYVDIPDVDGLRDEARDAVALGYAATACIHPSQVAVIRETYQPTDDEIAWAKRVVAGDAEHRGGVFKLDDQMVDGPVRKQAQAVLGRAGLGA